jgi:RHS repeat-associated protein
VTARRTEDTDRTEDLRGEERTYLYDALGNVRQETLRAYGRRGGVDQAERIRVTQTEYAQSATRWLIDKPSRVVVRDGAGEILTELRRYYDGPDFVGMPLGQADRGLLTREEHLTLDQATFQAHYAGMDAAVLGYHAGQDADGNAAMFIDAEAHAFTAAGQKRADRNALGHEKQYEYDPTGLFRTKLIDFLGETTFEYDRAVGEPLHIVYDDGTETHITYDAQGRMLSIAMPSDEAATPSRTMHYDDLSVPNSRTTTFRHGDGPGDVSTSVMYFDARGGEFLEFLETDGDRFVVSNLALENPWGDVRAEFEPIFVASSDFVLPDTAARAARRFFFDARGRTVRTVNHNGGVSTAVYRPFEIVTADANDNDDSPENRARGQFDTPRREEFDVFRDRTRTVEASGSGSELTTEFVPGPSGELLRVSDANGVMCEYEYDRLGNRLRIDQRDAGERRIWFDARRRAVRTVDARGVDVRAEIDQRGRLARLTADGEVVESYRYDDPAQNALGRLAEVEYDGGKQVFRYDAAGRLQRHEHHFDGQPAPHTVDFEYDRLGRETARIHGDGTRIATTLAPNGWVSAIPGVLNSIEYDPRGLPTRVEYANGVVTRNSYSVGVGRVETRRTVGPGGQVFEDLTYEYDRLGSVLACEDTATGGLGRREYAYDPLYQITRFTSRESGGVRDRNYTYTGAYNLSRFDESDLTMHYDDPLHPDRVAALTPDGGVREAIGYDGNGNTTSLPGQTFEYNFRDLPSQFVRADGFVADYRYDHKGIRISKRIDDGAGLTTETHFVGDLAEIRNGSPAYFVRLGHTRVAIIEAGRTRFVHSDNMGSTAFYSDDTGTKITAIAYRPFGNLASVDGPTDRRTYGTHVFDTESGLYYMKRRYYSPQLGRFLTADPVAVYQGAQYLSNPKALHPYIFSGNDPVNKIDLDGYSFWSVVGAIVGVIVAIAVAALVIMTGGALGVVLGLALAIGLVTVGYVVADATQGTAFGEFMRGFLIGLNAGFNAVLASALFGPVVGVTLGVINFLAAFDTIANSEVYQGILGWSSWLMPMSWLATAVGLIFFVLNVIPAIFTGNQVDAVRIENISIDWGTGTIVMEGGWLFLPGFHGGYNLGNFAYITPGATVTDHETGHTLTNAAFGSIFHFVGAIDENAIREDPHDAYAEKIAESHDPAPGFEIIPMWV